MFKKQIIFLLSFFINQALLAGNNMSHGYLSAWDLGPGGGYLEKIEFRITDETLQICLEYGRLYRYETDKKPCPNTKATVTTSLKNCFKIGFRENINTDTLPKVLKIYKKTAKISCYKCSDEDLSTVKKEIAISPKMQQLGFSPSFELEDKFMEDGLGRDVIREIMSFLTIQDFYETFNKNDLVIFLCKLSQDFLKKKEHFSSNECANICVQAVGDIFFRGCFYLEDGKNV